VSTELPVTRDDRTIRRVEGTGVALRGDDVDTDQILPARFLKEVTFDAMGEYVFYDQRHDDDGEPVGHPFNDRRGASILVVNDNFGCGSSREHAPQGLMRWGIRAVVGESFAEIFRDNCAAIGVPCATLPAETVERLQSFVEAAPEAELALDVADERLRYDGRTVEASIPDAAREALIEGAWDTTAVMRSTLRETRATAAALPYTSTAPPRDAPGDANENRPTDDGDPAGGSP